MGHLKEPAGPISASPSGKLSFSTQNRWRVGSFPFSMPLCSAPRCFSRTRASWIRRLSWPFPPVDAKKLFFSGVAGPAVRFSSSRAPRTRDQGLGHCFPDDKSSFFRRNLLILFPLSSLAKLPFCVLPAQDFRVPPPNEKQQPLFRSSESHGPPPPSPPFPLTGSSPPPPACCQHP